MRSKVLDELRAHVVQVKTDIEWIKRFLWISVGSSMTAVLGIVAQLLVNMFLRGQHP